MQTSCWLLLLILFFVKSTVNINPVHKLLQSFSAKSISFMTNIILIRFIQKKYHSHPMSLNTSTKADCLVFRWWNSNEQDKISRSFLSFFLVIDLLLLLGHLFWILVLRHTCKSPLENNKQYKDSITLLFNLKYIFFYSFSTMTNNLFTTKLLLKSLSSGC